MSSVQKSGPIEQQKNGPVELLGQIYGKRKYLKLQEVILFAEEYFDKTKKGINFSLLQKKFDVSKLKAQKVLKKSRANQLLFTPKNTKPQLYYPKSRRFEVVEYVSKEKSGPIDTTGATLLDTNNLLPANTNSIFDSIQNQKGNNFLESLVQLQLPLRPLQIHKIQIETTIDAEYYNLIQSESWKINHVKHKEERIDNKLVTYIYHKNGKVLIDIACSNNPFKIQTEEDLLLLYSFIGQVRDRFENQISDPSGRLVPQITNWILKQCDINKDIPITDVGQITLPDIQLKTAFGVFRLYVKNLEGKAHYRCEDSRVVNQPLREFLNSNINPNPVHLQSNQNIDIEAILEKFLEKQKEKEKEEDFLVVGQIEDKDKQTDKGPSYYYH